MLGRQQQASYQQYQHYASPGQQPLGQTYQNLTGNEPQQYAVAQPPSYHPNQSQPYQQYSDPQQGYPASYGATFPPQEQLHQQQYGYSPYGS
ncbi:hypothetical protein CCR75_000389 [Bremia lactucae]|nr:hypothetical protein CCR75_000389 [Bremia lactucae]